MMILGRMLANAVIIAGLFSFVPGVGTTTSIGLVMVAATLALLHSLTPWLLPLAGIPFTLGSFIIALVMTDALIVWFGISRLGLIFVTNSSAIVLVVVVIAILSWFIQSLGFDYYHKKIPPSSLPSKKNTK